MQVRLGTLSPISGQGLCLVASSRSMAELDLGPGFLSHPLCFCTFQTPPDPSSPTGLLNPLDSPHHMRQDEESEFREGIVVDRPTRPGHGSFVNCGMKKVGTGVSQDILPRHTLAVEGRQGM